MRLFKNKIALENFAEPKKNNKKAIRSQGLLKNVSALGVQNVTSQLLIKPRAKLYSSYKHHSSK